MKKSFKTLLIVLTLILSIILITGCSTESEEKSSNKTYGLNETFTFDDLEITLGKNITFTKVDNEFSEYDNQPVIKLPITVKNLKDETHSLNMFDYSIYGANGTELESVSSYFDDSIDYAGDLRTGASYTKYLYLLYDADGTYTIEFDDWTNKVIVEFNVTK